MKCEFEWLCAYSECDNANIIVDLNEFTKLLYCKIVNNKCFTVITQ